jgi:hypothetical protein
MSLLERHQTILRVRFGGWVALVVLVLMAAGCNQNYSRFSLDAQVSQAFQTGTALPEFNYYYAGRDTMPYAIIGIDRTYTVPSRYWIPFEPEPDTLKKMTGNMYWKMRYDPYGSNILASDGTIIGVWFSSVRNRSAKVDQQQRTVEVLFQNPENDRDF